MASLPNSTPPPAGGSPLDSTLTDNTQLSLSTRVACKKIQRTTAHSHGGTHHPDCPHQSVETEREGQNRRPAPRSLERKRRRRHRWLATRGEAPSPEAPPPPPVFACSVAPRVSLAKEIWFLQIHHLPRGEYHNSWSSHIVHLRHLSRSDQVYDASSEDQPCSSSADHLPGLRMFSRSRRWKIMICAWGCSQGTSRLFPGVTRMICNL
nr:uncharacterized protein LOC9269892 [Oryza sativa Japonica Group]